MKVNPTVLQVKVTELSKLGIAPVNGRCYEVTIRRPDADPTVQTICEYPPLTVSGSNVSILPILRNFNGALKRPKMIKFSA